ncbi:MAG TPA: alkaline phosphatase D family protein, partial [Burkholderiaceae bacterium]|nr:alkaline phosphatase D family protein [Burkholderiaceae bacterium]
STPANPSRRRWLAASALAAASGTSTSALEVPHPDGAPNVPTGAEDRRRLRIAFGSCANQSKPQPIWQAVRESRPDLFIFLGDNFYGDAEDEATLRRRYREFAAVESLQAFRREVPHLAIWDDHDYGTDDSGGDYPLKRLSQQLFCDAWGEAPDSPRRRRSGIYDVRYVQVSGHRIQVILLDLRFNRSSLQADPAQRKGYTELVLNARASGQPMAGWYRPSFDLHDTLLGEEQWTWLAQTLEQPADVRVIASSIQFAAEGTGWEGWANFPLEQRRLVKLLRDKRAEGAVFISGDMHYGDISCRDEPDLYPLWDATSSGLTEVWDVPTPNRRRRSEVLAAENFGLLDLRWDLEQPCLEFGICDLQGRVRLRQRVPLTELQLKKDRRP